MTGSQGADAAGGRAAFYELLIAVFGELPDLRLLTKIGSGEFESFLSQCVDLGDADLEWGLRLVVDYRSTVVGRLEEEVLLELSVDRTKILRGTGDHGLKPPYEGLYRHEGRIGDSVLEVRRFYRKAGLLPDEAVHEAPDFLCVELDFMRQLCLRERSRWLDNRGLRETLVQEDAFLAEHLGGWVGDFCSLAEQHAATGFYRGFARILGGFIGMEKEWVSDLLRQVH